MKKLSVVVGIASLMALSGVALAEGDAKCNDGGHGRGAMFDADANKDGKITLAEAVAAGTRHFDGKDANKDGVISGDEVKGRGERLFKRADANNDGKVTRAEGEALVRAVFTRKDANKDGVLTQDEMAHGPRGERHGQAGK
jgi:hypothetical protein